MAVAVAVSGAHIIVLHGVVGAMVAGSCTHHYSDRCTANVRPTAVLYGAAVVHPVLVGYDFSHKPRQEATTYFSCLTMGATRSQKGTSPPKIKGRGKSE